MPPYILENPTFPPEGDESFPYPVLTPYNILRLPFVGAVRRSHLWPISGERVPLADFFCVKNMLPCYQVPGTVLFTDF